MGVFYELPEYAAILTLLDSVLAQINIGLLIYHVEEADDPASLKLIYANAEASRCSGVDLTQKVGMCIHDAFPSLRDSDLPATYLEVAQKKEARHLGTVEYGDAELTRRTYTVKAFPMPQSCVGVLFESTAPAQSRQPS